MSIVRKKSIKDSTAWRTIWKSGIDPFSAPCATAVHRIAPGKFEARPYRGNIWESPEDVLFIFCPPGNTETVEGAETRMINGIEIRGLTKQ